MYYELAAERAKQGKQGEVAILRLEQLAPFPFDLVMREMRRFPNAGGCRSVVPCGACRHDAPVVSFWFGSRAPQHGRPFPLAWRCARCGASTCGVSPSPPPSTAEVVWAQEEPMNMGAYLHVQPRLQRSMEVSRRGCRRDRVGVAEVLWVGSPLIGVSSSECAGLHRSWRVHAPPTRAAAAAAAFWTCVAAALTAARAALRLPQATGREVPLRIKYSGRPSMASTATGFGEVHAQEQVRRSGVWE